MSIDGIGAYGSGSLSQVLASQLSRLEANSDSSSTDTTSTASTSQTVASPLTGSGKPSLSSMILGTLLGLQQQSGSTSDQSSTSSGSSDSDPLQNLFSAMDADSDGSVTQSEMESYIEQQGGTAAQADALYSSLNTSNSEGLSESDLASQAPPPPPHGHHGPGGAGGPPPSDQSSDSDTTDSDSTNDITSELLEMFDSNNDGTVSQSEFDNFVTSNGGTSAEASTDFSAIDSDKSGSLDSTDFQNAVDTLQQKLANNAYSPVMTLLNAFGSSVSVTA